MAGAWVWWRTWWSEYVAQDCRTRCRHKERRIPDNLGHAEYQSVLPQPAAAPTCSPVFSCASLMRSV